MDGKDDPIKNDKFHIVDGTPWPAHHVNMGQFFSVTDQGLLFKEQSFGLMFQQKIDPMSQQEIQQLFLQYFSKLTRISGTGVAYKDGRQALMQQQAAAQLAAAPLAAAPLPAAIASPSITIASVPGSQLAMASPGMVPGKVPIAAPMPAPAPMISPIQFPMQVGHKCFGAAAPMPAPAPMSYPGQFPMQVDHNYVGAEAMQAMQQRQPASSSCSSSSQAMQQRQQLRPCLPPAAPPPVPPPSAMPGSSMQPAHPSAGVPQVFGAAPAASPSWSSNSHVQVQLYSDPYPAQLDYLWQGMEHEKEHMLAILAARQQLKKQLQQQQQ